jgi:PAT family beta-lactamase induction signal transducer AmpG
MYGAMLLETAAMGLGTGAFSVLLLRLTQKRFSATQYALLSSIFAVGRTAAGPLAGVLIDALGWMNFFIVTMIAAIPGLVMLQRFVPFGTREPTFQDEPPRVGRPIGLRALAARAAAGAFVGLIVAAIYTATLEAFRAMRTTPGTGFSLEGPFERIFTPSSFSDWFTLAAVVVFALTCGLATAALAVARRGLARD